MNSPKQELDYQCIRRLQAHIADGTTDLAADVMEVPVAAYTSPEHYQRELDTLFLGRPLVLCLSGALPGPGSYITMELCGTPLLLARGTDGVVRSFLNSCRHRGVKVIEGTGRTRRFTCPFHAWSYDLEGELASLPVESAFEGMCREDKGLIELPVAEGYGLIVGRLRPGTAVDMDEYLGPELAHELSLVDIGGWKPFSDPHTHPVGGGWKVTLDTFRENYHFDYLHSTTLKSFAYGGVLTFDAFGPHIRNCSAVRSIDELNGKPQEEWGDVTRHFTYQYCFFPNTSLTVAAKHIELWQILPVDPGRSEVLHTAYVRPDLDEADVEAEDQMIQWICEKVVDPEDFWIAGQTEPGLSTGIATSLVFGRNEPALQHLHRGYLAATTGADGSRTEKS